MTFPFEILPENILPETYKEYTYDFKVLKRIDDVVIAEQSSEGKVVGYEVYKVQKAPPKEIYGKHYPAKEMSPSASQWGVYGFTVFTLEDAEKKMQLLLNRTATNE